MPFKERAAVIRAIEGVDFVIDFDDADNSAKHAIWMVRQSYPTDKIIFCNGGDRTQANIPEMATDDANIEFVFGVVGENKANSSSWILQEWKAPKTIRPWGYYRVLHEVPGMKVKELTIDPDGALSMQRHASRSEFWMISEGSCIVHSQMRNGYALPSKTLNQHDEYKVPQGEWHQLVNPFPYPCKIVEIQYGAQCTEEDIERK
jgi:mannose-6-phosphate isomerase-like protein (cupin superfamily)